MALTLGNNPVSNFIKNRLTLPGDYLVPCFLRYLDPSQVDTIFEVGSRDGRDALRLRDYFSASVHAFECNPDSVVACRQRLAGEEGIHFCEKAVWEENTIVPFFPIVSTKSFGERIATNVGASSCFQARADCYEVQTQVEVRVDAIRLDTYCAELHIETIDLLCVDVQGASLQVFKGLGEKLKTVKYIITEIEREPMYHGESLFPEVQEFLSENNFIVVEEFSRGKWFSDYLFISAGIASL